ncbi:MAK11 [Candida theae]|uniref:MAK11 n=1 Tax=Candida theae TaxID=1198502 RepID=A0AAD5FZ00_9ASCO|nr:MAK11 [Candida theae]KAI5958601.1 MAK11 [Candida theae]
MAQTQSKVENKAESNFEEKEIKSALKGSNSTITSTTNSTASSRVQFRIFVGSYEHNLLCLSVILDPSGTKEPIFQPIFHFQAHALSIKSMDLAKRYLVTGSNDEHIRIYDLQKRKELGTLLSHQGTITALRFSREATEEAENASSGRWLLSGSEDGKIIIWRTKDWEIFATLKGHTDKINDLSIHPSGRVAISVSQDKTIRLWNLMTAKKAAVLKIKGKDHLGQSGEFVKWSHTGDYFVVGLHNQVLLYKTSTAKIVKKYKFKSTVMCIDLLKIDDKEWLVIGFGDGSIGFYDFETLLNNIGDDAEDQEQKILDNKAEVIEPIFTLRGHTNRIKGITFMQNQDTQNVPLLISVSSDGKIVVWNLTLKDQVAVYDTGERLNCVVCAPESVEKVDTMKRRFGSLDELKGEEQPDVSESEYETDGEEIKSIMKGPTKKGKKKSKKSKKRKVNVTLE